MSAFRKFGFCFAACALLALPRPAIAAEETPPPAKPEITTNAANSPEVLRSYLQLQEQLHAALLAIERGRLENNQAAQRNADALAAKLQALQDSLVVQRARELQAMEGANRLMLYVGGGCAALGFLAMLLTAYFQWRAVGRLTEFSMVSQASLTLGRGLPAPGGSTALVANAAAAQANDRLFGALEKIEARILELEHTAHAPLAKNGDAATTTGTFLTDAAQAPASDHVTALLSEGAALLSSDKAEEALAVFDEILALEPGHTETLVKKGEALERLRRADDAIACYDRAIAADASMTIAYLHKGGLFNRMERYEEALKCYEQALRTQEKSHAA